jgi:hypothetical protein
VPGTEFQGIFILEWNGDAATLQLEENEVQQVTWNTIDEIAHHVIEERNEQWTFIGYEHDLLSFLQK